MVTILWSFSIDRFTLGSKITVATLIDAINSILSRSLCQNVTFSYLRIKLARNRLD